MFQRIGTNSKGNTNSVGNNSYNSNGDSIAGQKNFNDLFFCPCSRWRRGRGGNGAYP